MGVYTIRELENLSGIKAHTIRVWEKRYGLIAPQRTSTNIRMYCDTELKKLLNVSILNRNGLKISKIARLSQDEIVTRINQYSHDTASTESHIENLTVAMIDMDEFRFEQVLARSIIQFGFEDAVTRVLFPFMVKIGLMWQTGAVNPAQEHFISNLVRQKFFAAIDALDINIRIGKHRFIFFLPEGELHEIGLLYLCYLVKKKGHRTIYLGQSVPLNDISEIVNARGADYLVTGFITSINGNDMTSYTKMLSAKFSDKILFISGIGALRLDENLPDNVVIISSPDQFSEELEKI